jgi:two-component system, LuxR family, sensor kinase FixL
VDDLIRVAGESPDADLLNGMIHQLSQPLGAITNYAAVCHHYLTNGTSNGDDQTEVVEVVRRIAEQASRATEITRRLKSLVPGEDVELSVADVDDLVEEVVSALGPNCRLNGVEVQLKMEDRLPKITTDRVRLMQAVAAILKNAVEAVSGNQRDCRQVTIGARRKGDAMVEITVEDSGPGLGGKELDLVCSPSYTTKPGRLGLGLPVSRSVVETLGGRLEAASVAGSGAVFRIVLPIQSKELNVEY